MHEPLGSMNKHQSDHLSDIPPFLLLSQMVIKLFYFFQANPVFPPPYPFRKERFRTAIPLRKINFLEEVSATLNSLHMRNKRPLCLSRFIALPGSAHTDT